MFGDHHYGDDPFIDFDESIEHARGAVPEQAPREEPELPRSRRSWVRRAHMAFEPAKAAENLPAQPERPPSDMALSGVFDDSAEEILDDALVHLGGAVTGLETKIQDLGLEDLHHLNAFLGELRAEHEQRELPLPPPIAPPPQFYAPPPAPPQRMSSTFRVFLERSAMVFIGMVLVSVASGIMVTILILVVAACGLL